VTDYGVSLRVAVPVMSNGVVVNGIWLSFLGSTIPTDVETLLVKVDVSFFSPRARTQDSRRTVKFSSVQGVWNGHDG